MEFPLYSGLLPIYKPKGMVSKDVSRKLERHFGKDLHLGHVGTLDPMAEGVLPLLLGNATRLQDFLVELPKSYVAEVELGFETDSLDLEGTVVENGSWEHVTSEEILFQATKFVGKRKQTPPLYSAVKFKGKPLYKYAREGKDEAIDIEKLSREISVYHFEILNINLPKITFVVTCSAGTYIRVLAKELALSLKSVGTLVSLKRIASSGFQESDTILLEDVLNLPEKKDLTKFLCPIEKFPLKILRLSIVDRTVQEKLYFGQTVILKKDVTEDQEFGLSSQETTGLLLNEEGRAFSLATVCAYGDGQIKVRIKRSLL